MWPFVVGAGAAVLLWRACLVIEEVVAAPDTWPPSAGGMVSYVIGAAVVMALAHAMGIRYERFGMLVLAVSFWLTVSDGGGTRSAQFLRIIWNRLEAWNSS